MTRGSNTWRRRWWGEPCSPTLARVDIGRARISVDQRAAEAFAALGDILTRHDYDIHPAYPEGDTGAYNCRHMRHDPDLPMSSHAWGTAVDINWNTNPDGSRLVTDIPPAAIADVHRLATTNGAPVFRWGGDWDRDPRTGHSYYDAMHFEVTATPGELATGIRTTTGVFVEPICYGRRGTPDRSAADWATDAANRGSSTSNLAQVRLAAQNGSDVIAVGTPADDDLDGVPHRSVRGDDALHTGILLARMLREG